MNGSKPNLFVPALIGGAAAGVLCGIPFVNCLCCLWIIGGAALAAALLAKDSPVSLTPGDGALVGAYAGVVAAVVHAVISIPLAALNAAFFNRFLERLSEYVHEMPSGWDRWFSRGAEPFSMAWFFLGLIFTAAVFAAFGALGGVIGASLFGRKTPAAPVPPPAAPLPPQPGNPA